MARQFKISVSYIGPPVVEAELYWHDNDTIEFVSIPPSIGPDSFVGRTKLVEDIIHYFKTAKVYRVEIKKGPPF